MYNARIALLYIYIYIHMYNMYIIYNSAIYDNGLPHNAYKCSWQCVFFYHPRFKNTYYCYLRIYINRQLNCTNSCSMYIKLAGIVKEVHHIMCTWDKRHLTNSKDSSKTADGLKYTNYVRTSLVIHHPVLYSSNTYTSFSCLITSLGR